MTGRYNDIDMHRSGNTGLKNISGSPQLNSGHFIYAFGSTRAVQGIHTNFRKSLNRISETEAAHITNAGITGPYNSAHNTKTESVRRRLIHAAASKDGTSGEDIRFAGADKKADSTARNAG